MNIEDAITIAIEAHKGQVDKCGERYILHPMHVMEQVNTEDEKVCAILHDVVEDTPWTLEQLKEQGLTDVQSEALDLLTHQKGVPYLEYVKNLSTNDIARSVKTEDLKHNLDLTRMRKAVAHGADIAKMERKRRLYMYAYSGFLFKYYKRDWFTKMEELFSEPGFCYTGHHEPTGEDWCLLGIDVELNLVCAAGYPPSQGKLNDFSSITKWKAISEEELAYRNLEFPIGHWN